MKNQSLIKKSILKNKKLCTRVQKFAPSSDKLCTPYKEEIKQDKELKKKKEKRLSRHEIGESSAPETATTFPTFFCGSVKEEKSANAGADSKLVENLLCKKERGLKWQK